MLVAENIQSGRVINSVRIELKPHSEGSSFLKIFEKNRSFFDEQVLLQERSGLCLTVPAVHNITLGFLNDVEGNMFLSHFTNNLRTPELASEYARHLVQWLNLGFDIVDLSVASYPTPLEEINPLGHTTVRTAQVLIPILADLFGFDSKRSDKPFKSISDIVTKGMGF